jgi:polyisoprenoid-binding protein YceI
MAWVIDPAHSEIQFSAKHLMISAVRGRFNAFTGTIDADENNPTAAKVDVQIDASSLVTGEERRDTHLRSPDFLDVEKYPYLTFKSTRVERIDEAQGKLYGELTIRDVTKPVVGDQRALSDTSLDAYAQALSLDTRRFAQDKARHAHLDRVRADVESGIASGVDRWGRCTRSLYAAPAGVYSPAVCSAKCWAGVWNRSATV